MLLETTQPPAQRARREWWWFAVLWLAVGAAVAGSLWLNRLQVQARERHRLAHQADVLHDNLVRQLHSVHAVLDRLVQDPLQVPLDPATRQQANVRLHTFSQALAGVRTMSLLDAQGEVVASSREAIIGQRAAHRDYFRSALDAVAQGELDTLVVGEPFQSPIDGGWYMALARILRDPQGGFAGVAVATLDPREFHTLLSSVRYAPDMVAGLVHGDGLRFALLSEQPEPPGVDVAQPGTLFDLHRESGAPASVLLGPMRAGAPPMLMAVRTIAPPELQMDTPLVAGAARDWHALLDLWRARAMTAAGGHVLLGAGAGLVLLLVQRRRRDAFEHARALARKEEALEARWRTVLQATSLGVWEWRRDRPRYVYFSPAWQELLGYGDGEGGEDAPDWRSRLHPDERRRVLAQLWRHLRGQTQLYETTHRVRRKDGSWRWVAARGRVLERDARGRALRFVGTYGDVAEHGEHRIRLDHLAESMPGVLYQFQREPDGRHFFPYASAGMLRTYGQAPEALREDGAPLFDFIHPEDRQRVDESIVQSAQTLQDWHAEYRVILPGRGERWHSGQARPQRLSGGGVLWHGYIHDVTQAKQQALQLQETERLLQHLMHEMPVGLAMVDEAGRMYFRNRRFLDYFGYTEAEVPTLEAWWRQVYPDPHYRAEVVARWDQALAQAARSGGVIAPQEYRTRAKDGTEHTMGIGGLTFGSHFLATFVDRTEQQAQSELLRKLAYMDSLTSVANRRHFDQTLEAEWRRCRRNGRPLALVMVDIDHFKQFNDLYGHQQGDACLRSVADALRTALGRSHDLVARYGGEEFVCLLPECDLAGATAKAHALREAVQALAIAHRGSAGAGVVTISAGVAALVPDAQHTPEDLLARADAHLYRAKARGRNSVDNGTGALPLP